MSVFDQLRKEYQTRGLDRDDLHPDPLEQFDDWFSRAVETCPGSWLEPNAMTLSTSAGNRVTSRTVLLKDVDNRRLTFFTNYRSIKGQQMEANPCVSLLFHWAWLGRQVRVEGTVERTSREVSQVYFHARPRGAQLSALASEQSSVLPSKEPFLQRRRQLELQYHDQDIPLPEHWGGYYLTPTLWEFWQGSEDRSHDRFQYRPDVTAGHWLVERLAP